LSDWAALSLKKGTLSNLKKISKKGSAELQNLKRFFRRIRGRNALYETVLGSIQNLLGSIEQKMVRYKKYEIYEVLYGTLHNSTFPSYTITLKKFLTQ
jgi:hypothetical protein